MLSGPVALCGSRFARSFLVPSFQMVKLGMSGKWVSQGDGICVESSLVNTLQNWSFSMVALVVGSLCANPSCFRGYMPQLSHLLDLTSVYSFFGFRSVVTISLMYVL
ncbi:hypothetical protein DPMN_166756 [Dreissena polymorpha]|uniref:Uncharacterized protein n=1 Tax=Dreissena polymorpha TaxID=45954 RepID=A0A9D4F2P2_DREPO|nr:hypothetical protein DPMN_166756 [Dreissena polymorpha]